MQEESMCHRAAYHLEQFEDKSTNEADNNDSMFSLVRSPNHCSQLSEPSVWTGHQPKTCRYSVRYLDGRRQRGKVHSCLPLSEYNLNKV
jgi:hypothetical protein